VKRLIVGAVVASALITVPVVLATGSPDGNSLFIAAHARASLKTVAKFTVTDDLYKTVGAPAYLAAPSPLTAGWRCSKKLSPASCVSGGGTFVPVHPGTSPAVTVSCPMSTQALQVLTPSYTDGPITLPSAPTFMKCSDNITPKPDYTAYPTTGLPPGCSKYGCHETLVSHGTWTSTFNDAGDSGGETPGAAGDTIGIQGPHDGLSSISAATPVCVIDVNPSSVVPTGYPGIGGDGPALGDYNDATGADVLPAGGTPSNALVSFQIEQNPSSPSPACPLAGAGSTPPDQGHAAFSGAYTISPLLGDS
jgi:hypothetical protein